MPRNLVRSIKLVPTLSDPKQARPEWGSARAKYQRAINRLVLVSWRTTVRVRHQHDKRKAHNCYSRRHRISCNSGSGRREKKEGPEARPKRSTLRPSRIYPPSAAQPRSDAPEAASVLRVIFGLHPPTQL